MTLGPRIEPGAHWWEASALTTAPPLLPYKLVLANELVGVKPLDGLAWNPGG